ncbi:MAG TPA: DUF4139 domain-containing protein [Myxococcota bacterium]|nr:DUF4139 domain-containing protein [Myxococcota bacterium]
MRGIWLATLVGVAALAPGARAQEPAPTRVRSTPADRSDLGITVYSGGFGLIRETRALPLAKGRSELEFAGVAETIQPETVQIHALGPANLRVLEQNYRYDLLSPEKLLEKYVGKNVRVLRWSESRGRDEERDAVVLTAGPQPILRVGDEITWAFPGRISFPEIPKNLIARPSLVWLLESGAEKPKVEVSYLAQSLGWKADYVLVVDAADTTGDFNGWVTLDNKSGAAFENAKLQLVAGDVHRVTPEFVLEDRREKFGTMAAAAPPQFREEGLFEYHLYTLERPASLLENETKQIALLEASGVKLQKRLVLRGEPMWFHSQIGDGPTPTKINVSLELENKAAEHLGMPLPKGIIRVYKADSGGGRQFLGEDRIDHTPRDEKVRVRVGDAFDVIGERRQMDYKVIGSCRSESAWQIDLRNHKDTKVEVDVIEPSEGDWEIVSSSQKAVKEDAHTFSFRVPVPANGSARVEYRVRVRWC